jgi:WD40 repeat protein
MGSTSSLRFAVTRHEIRSDRLPPGVTRLPFPVAMSPDREVMASYRRWDDTIRLWSVAQSRPVHLLPRYRDPPVTLNHIIEDQVVFSPDGKLLAAAYTRTSLALWNVATGRLYRHLHDLPIEMGFAFIPDGQRVVSGGRHFRYWDIARGQENRRYPRRAPVAAVAFTPDGKNLITAAGLEIRLWEPATDRERPQFKVRLPSRGLLYPRDQGTGRELRWLGGRERIIGAMAVGPDGKTIASGSDDGFLWFSHLATGRAIREIQGFTGPVTSIAFASDGKCFAAFDEMGVWIGDPNTGTEVRRMPASGKNVFKSLSFSPDGSILAVVQGHRLSLWNLKLNHLQMVLNHPEGAYLTVSAFSPDGKSIAAGDVFGMIRVWELYAKAKERAFGREIPPDTEPPRILCLAFTPHGKALASGGDDRFVTLWDLETGQERRRLEGHAAGVNSMAVAPDGKTLASASEDGTALIWKL